MYQECLCVVCRWICSTGSDRAREGESYRESIGVFGMVWFVWWRLLCLVLCSVKREGDIEMEEVEEYIFVNES